MGYNRNITITKNCQKNLEKLSYMNMEVRFINYISYSNPTVFNLTYNKIYKVEKMIHGNTDKNGLYKKYYYIMNDFGIYYHYDVSDFITLVEERNQKLDKILN